MTQLHQPRRAILVIEDNDLLRAMYDMLLSEWGYRFRSAASTSGALAILDDGFVPDAVVADYSLGGGDTGTAAIQAVCDKLGRRVPAIIVTGEDKIPVAGLPVLRKPILPGQLEPAIREMFCQTAA